MTRIEEVIEAGLTDLRDVRELLGDALTLLRGKRDEEALAKVEEAYGLIYNLLETDDAKIRP